MLVLQRWVPCQMGTAETYPPDDCDLNLWSIKHSIICYIWTIFLILISNPVNFIRYQVRQCFSLIKKGSFTNQRNHSKTTNYTRQVRQLGGSYASCELYISYAYHLNQTHFPLQPMDSDTSLPHNKPLFIFFSILPNISLQNHYIVILAVTIAMIWI